MGQRLTYKDLEILRPASAYAFYTQRVQQHGKSLVVLNPYAGKADQQAFTSREFAWRILNDVRQEETQLWHPGLVMVP